MNFFRIPRVYLTLKCNYGCSFCVLERKRKDTISGKEWIKILNDWPGDEVILAGGEPTIHPDFIEIVNGLNKKEVRVYSNMSFPIGMLRKLIRKVSWYVSFHPGHRDSAEAVIEKAKAIKARNDTLYSIHINEASENYASYVGQFERQGINLLVEKNLFEKEEWKNLSGKQFVECTYPRVYFGPDGKRYSCVAKMESGDPSGIIEGDAFPAVTKCAEYGKCNVCDVVCHSIRNLDAGSMRIEPIHDPAADGLSNVQNAVDDYGVNHWLKHKMWESIYQPGRPWHLNRLRAILDNVKGSEFLDVACATGEITEEVRKKINPKRCVGYEGSRAVIEKGKELHQDIDFIQGLVESMPFKDGEFDCIHAGEIIEHVKDPDGFIEKLSKITRRQLIITTPSTWVRDPGHIAIFTESGFKEALEKHFDTVRIIDAERTFVAICEKGKRKPTRALKKKSRPSLLYLANVRFDVASGYVTQVQYQLQAMSTVYDVTYAVPRHPDTALLWRPIENVTLKQIDLPPGEYWNIEGREWLDEFDLIVYRNPQFWALFENMVSPEKTLFYVSGTNISNLIHGQVDQSLGVVNQGSDINKAYVDMGLSEKKAIAIPCTVPLSRFALNGKPTFTVVSSITKDKGIEDIIDALEPMKSKIRLVIVGGFLPNHVKAEPQYYAELRHRLETSWCEWIGEVHPNAIPYLLHGCTAMIHYNRMKGRYDETLQSTKILEAMAAGKPVIAFASEGTISLVGKNYPYAVKSKDDLKAAAEKIIANPKTAATWGIKLQKRIAKYFDVGIVGRKWGDLLNGPNRLIWLTSCQFNHKKGDAAQSLYALESLSAQGIHVDVVFAPDKNKPPTINRPIDGVEYHIVKNPQETAICLWAEHKESAVLARGLKLADEMIGAIPKENLYAYLYGNHWKASAETIDKIKTNCSAVFTQGKEIKSIFEGESIKHGI